MNNNSDEKRMSNVEGVEVDMEEEISPKDHIVLKSRRRIDTLETEIKVSEE